MDASDQSGYMGGMSNLGSVANSDLYSLFKADAQVIRGRALSLPAHHAQFMQEIRLDTFGALLEHGHGLE